MKIYLTRHSKTLWNQEKRLQGWCDSPLTSQGIQDAKDLGQYVKNISIDYIYSSPLNRAYQTAQTIFEDRDIIADDRIKEMNFGIYEGQWLKDLQNDKAYQQLWSQPQPTFSLEGGETYQDVVDRYLQFIHEKYLEDPDQTIFLVIHGMLMTIVHGLALHLPIERFHEVNGTIVQGCSLSLIEYDGQHFNIDYIGQNDFLSHQDKSISYRK